MSVKQTGYRPPRIRVLDIMRDVEREMAEFEKLRQDMIKEDIKNVLFCIGGFLLITAGSATFIGMSIVLFMLL